MKVKICGIKTKEEAQIINDAMPDFTGFVFAKSKRQVNLKTAAELKNILNPKIKTAGVFTDTMPDKILEIAKSGVIDIAQLHGNYTEDDIKTLKNQGLQTIKVIRVQSKNYDVNTGANYILFDYFSPDFAGGAGMAFDWNTKIKTNVPFFIAGGLNSANIETMAKKLKPYGIDISSGAEENGFKTRKKVFGIMKIAKGISL